MIKTVILHHEDWDFNQIFADLRDQGVQQVKLRIPPEWQETEAVKLAHAKNLISAAEKFNIKIIELTGHEKKPSVIVPQPNGGSKKLLILLIPLILLILLIIGGVFLSQRAFDQHDREQRVSPLTQPPPATATPAPTAVPTLPLDRGDLTLRVLNGLGKGGAARAAAERLEKLGYRIVKTGNASSYDFQESLLRLKPNSELYRDLLLDDLEGRYIIGSGSALPLDDIAAAELTVGKQ